MRMEKSPACLVLERKGYRNTLWPEMFFLEQPAGYRADRLFREIITWET